MRSLILFTIVALGCSSGPHVASDGTPLVENFNPPPPPDNALQIVSPIIPAFPAGANKEFCYYTKIILKEEMIFKSGQGFQTPGGHHVVAYWGMKTKPEQVKECTEDDMVSLHVLTGGGAEAGNGIVNGLPEGTAFHVPAGAQIVLNIHLLNASPAALDEQAVVNLYFGDASLTPVTSFYVTGTDMSIAPGETKTYAAGCKMKYPQKVVRLLGHMHEWGTRSVITLTRDGGQPSILYDKPGAPDFAYNAPYVDFPVANPLLINVGDTVQTSCTWTNTTGKTLAFPDEMCAAFGYTIGNDPEHGCADGAWDN